MIRSVAALSPPSLASRRPAPCRARRRTWAASRASAPNQLTGYGVVVGLPGTGDDNLEYTVQSMKAVASRFGLQLPPSVNPGMKNAAVVMITAELPAFAKPGQKLDITVSVDGQGQVARAAAR